jgi:hypothetical protein
LRPGRPPGKVIDMESDRKRTPATADEALSTAARNAHRLEEMLTAVELIRRTKERRRSAVAPAPARPADR